jgi:hypothetical protein
MNMGKIVKPITSNKLIIWLTVIQHSRIKIDREKIIRPAIDRKKAIRRKEIIKKISIIGSN